jgi:hypothetical protein
VCVGQRELACTTTSTLLYLDHARDVTSNQVYGWKLCAIASRSKPRIENHVHIRRVRTNDYHALRTCSRPTEMRPQVRLLITPDHLKPFKTDLQTCKTDKLQELSIELCVHFWQTQFAQQPAPQRLRIELALLSPSRPFAASHASSFYWSATDIILYSGKIKF